MMTKRKESVWLEVALNGAASQQFQPGIPVSEEDIIAEGIACANEGASIIHLHAYNEAGQSVEDADIYSRLIEGIRAKCNAIVYPTLGLGGTCEERYAPIKILMERGLLESGVIDPGSVNLVHKLHLAMGSGDFVYPNPTEHIREGLRLASEGGWRPAYAIYEPGFARLGAAMAAAFPDLKTPIYRIMFSDNLLFGTTPNMTALKFYAAHLTETAPGAPWMISGLDANIQSLIEPAISLGAHVRVGLEDAPLGTSQSNLDYVKSAVKIIRNMGSELATPDEVRAA